MAINDGHITIRSHDKGITTGWKPWRDARTPSTDDDPDPRITINGGTIDITTTGTPARDTDDEGDNNLSPEGIEAKSVLHVRGGNLKVITTDDSISAGMHLELSGGRTYAYSSHDDAVDSNGTLTIAGGVLVAISHAPRPEGALDSDSNRFAITRRHLCRHRCVQQHPHRQRLHAERHHHSHLRGSWSVDTARRSRQRRLFL